MACGHNALLRTAGVERRERRFSIHLQSSGLETDSRQLPGTLASGRGAAGHRDFYFDTDEESNHRGSRDVRRMPPDFRLRMDWRIQQRHLGARARVLVGVHAPGIVLEGY